MSGRASQSSSWIRIIVAAAVLYLAAEVFIPIALALLLTFLLAHCREGLGRVFKMHLPVFGLIGSETSLLVVADRCGYTRLLAPSLKANHLPIQTKALSAIE